MKIELSEIPVVLHEEGIENPKIDSITGKLTKIIEEIKNSKDKRKNKKSEYVIVISDPEGKFAGAEVTGWVTQIEEGTDAGTVLDKIVAGIREFNVTKKGQKNPIRTIGEGIQHVVRKFFKAQKIQVKHKEPVRVVFTNNQLPQ